MRYKIIVETYGTAEEASNIHLAIMDIVKESISVTIQSINENNDINAEKVDK